MRKNLAILMGLLALMLAAAACTPTTGGPVEPPAEVPADDTPVPEPTLPTPTETPAPTPSEEETGDGEAASNLDGTAWDLIEMDGQPVERLITIRFEGREVSGSDGCNSFGGSYTVSGSTISFDSSGFFATQMACEPDVMDMGARYLAVLVTAESFVLENDTLTINTAEGDLVYEKPIPATIENTRWVLGGTLVGGDAFVRTAIDSEIFIKLEDGQVSGFTGCNNLMGSYTLEGNFLSFGPLATTKKACEAERNEREAIVLEWLEKTAVVEVERQVMGLSDENGMLLMNFQIESESRGEMSLFVGAEQVDCVGEGPQTCLLIKEDPAADWTYFYDTIEGFEWEAGYEYELKVSVSEVEDPPADGSSLRYELIEVVSKMAVE
ncbi:MAG: META and DUF4377 domain-containing protein [Ardenticatenaceae bacterium]|nr:META and DUF4377 domain-containing protein [Ardenticatenaceae bacterium]